VPEVEMENRRMVEPRERGGIRVLVVDDEPQNLELMEALLQEAGYESILASGVKRR
jgi:CheY-like chemotaxis protein